MRACKPFPDGKIFICSPHHLPYCDAPALAPGRISFRWKEHQSCDSEKDTLQKIEIHYGFHKRSHTGESKSSTIIFGSCLYKGSLIAQSFKCCKESLKRGRAVPASHLQDNCSCCLGTREGRKVQATPVLLDLMQNGNWDIFICFKETV